MPVFRMPGDFPWDLDEQLAALRAYPTLPGKADRAIPPKADDRLLLATWNIANLGAQNRREKDYRLLAEIIGWFDLIALQEVNADLRGLQAIRAALPSRYRAIFSDAGGNDERFAFLYDADKITLREEVGELTIPAADLPKIKLRDIPARFVGFDRNPMIASFAVRDTLLLLAGVHLYFGSARRGLPDDEDDADTRSPRAAANARRRREPPPAKGIDRRVLEAFAIAWWADQRHRDETAYTQNVIALGDFNLPRQAPGDRVYDALTDKGLHLPQHSTKVGGSNVRDTASYDQMALWPGTIADAIEQVGIFDFDGAVFRELWGGGTETEQTRFFGYVQYYLSDHRPLWAALTV